jgi:hypothetical protein
MGDWQKVLEESEVGSQENASPKASDFLKRAGTFADIAGQTTFAKESPTRATIERGLTNITLGAYPHLKAAVQSVQRGVPYAEALADVRVSQEANEQAFPKSTLAGDVGSLIVPSGATSALNKMKSLPAVGNLARRALIAQKRSPGAYSAGRGAIAGLSEGIRADQTENGEPSLSFDPMSSARGAAFSAGITKAPAAMKYAGEKLGQLGRGAVEVMTNTSPALGEMVSKRPDIYRDVTQAGAPASSEIAQQGIGYIEQILGKQAKPFIESSKFKKEAELLASAEIPKRDLLKNLRSLKDQYSSKQNSASKAQIDAIYNEYKRYISSGGRGSPVASKDVMTYVQDLQSKAKSMTPGTYSSMPTATQDATKFTKNIASDFNKMLGERNPGYSEKMREASKLANKGETIKKYLGNTNDPREYATGEIPIDPQKVGNVFFSKTKVPGIGQKRSMAEEYLTSERYMSPEQTTKIKDIQNKYLMKKELEARTANGARNILGGTTAGVGSAYIASRVLDTDPIYTAITMGTLGSMAGGVVDKYGAPIAGKMYSGINKMSGMTDKASAGAKYVSDSLRSQFPREYKVLADAASRGKKRYASTMFIMQQSNPEFNKYVNELKEENEQQDKSGL